MIVNIFLGCLMVLLYILVVAGLVEIGQYLEQKRFSRKERWITFLFPITGWWYLFISGHNTFLWAFTFIRSLFVEENDV